MISELTQTGSAVGAAIGAGVRMVSKAPEDLDVRKVVIGELVDSAALENRIPAGGRILDQRSA